MADQRITERQAEPSGPQMRLVGGEGRGRDGRGWGQTSQKGRNSRWGHRQAPPLPQGQPKARFLCPAPHWGPRSRGSPAHCPVGRPHLGEEGGVVKLCSCKANPVLVRPAWCVGGAACPSHPSQGGPRTQPRLAHISTGGTPASEVQGMWPPRPLPTPRSLSRLCLPGPSDQGLTLLPPVCSCKQGVLQGWHLAPLPAPHPGPGTQEILSEHWGASECPASLFRGLSFHHSCTGS